MDLSHPVFIMFMALVKVNFSLLLVLLSPNEMLKDGINGVEAQNRSNSIDYCSPLPLDFTGFFDCCPLKADLSKCLEECPCQFGGYCDFIEHTCRCPSGRSGLLCEETCPFGTYGVECVQRCTCGDGALCDPYSGLCSCQPNKSCMICREGFYGPTCKLTCPCDVGVLCDSFTGHCLQGPQASGGNFWTDFSISEMAAIALGAALLVVMVIGGALLIRSCCKHRSSRMLTLTRLPSDEPCRYTVDSDHIPAATAVTATKRHSAVFLTSDGDASIYWNQRASHFERQLPTIPGEGRLLRPASAQPLMRKHYERRSLRTERAPRCVSVACGEKLEFHRETPSDKTKLPVRPPNVGRLSGSEGNLCLPMRKENYGCTASASIPDYSRHSRVAKRNGNYDHLTRPVSWVSHCSRDSSPEPSPDGYHRLETPPTLRVKRGDTNKERPGSSSNDLDFHSLHDYDHAPKLPPMKRGHLEKTDSAPLTENNYEEPLKLLRDSKRENRDHEDDIRKRTRDAESEFRRKDSETSGENMYEVLTAP